MSEISERTAAKTERVRGFDLERLSWDDLRVFMVAAREGSFRKASISLKTSASTVIRRVERLEFTLGTTLLTRVPEGIVLTVEGQKIANAVETMERASDSMRAFLDPDLGSRGVVRIAVSEGIGTYWIMPHLAEFNKVNPFTIVDIRATMDYADVLRSKADFAIQLTRPEAPDVIATKIARIHIYPFASKAYAERFGLPENMLDALNHRLVDQVAPMLDDGMIPKMLGLDNVEGIVAMRTSSSTAHYEAVLHGVGIGAIPTYAIARGADLIPVDIGMKYHLDVWMTCNADAREIPRVRMMMDWMRSIFDPVKYEWFRDEFSHPNHFKAHSPIT